MICSNCGMECGEVKYCSNCGSKMDLFEKNDRHNMILPEAPVGMYRGVKSGIELGPNSLTIYRKAFLKTFRKTIPYRELYAVSFTPAKTLWAGQLCLKEWQDRKKPLPEANGVQAVTDDASVIFYKPKNQGFELVYQYLKTCAELAKNTLTEECLEQDQEMLGKYEGPNGFMELHRDRVTFYNIKSFRREVTKTVWYDQLAEVAMLEAKWYRWGALTVREKTIGKNMRKVLRNAPEDDTSFSFEKQYNDIVQRIYAFLLEQIRKNQTAQ